jgi:hypothetical protein
MNVDADRADRDRAEEAKAERIAVHLWWVSAYGLGAAGLLGLLGACVGLAPGGPDGLHPSAGGALYLAAGAGAFWLLRKALGRP